MPEMKLFDIPGDDRFPALCLSLDGKRYRISGVDASRFGLKLKDAARRNYGNIDLHVRPDVIAECELTLLDKA